MAREIFLDVLKTDAAILPRIVALGDIDEDELAFAGEAEHSAARRRSKFRRNSASSIAGWRWRNWSRPGPKQPGVGAAGGRRPGLDAGAGRRPRAADGRHGDARRRLGRARRAGAGPSSTNTGSTRWNSCRSRARPGRLIWRKSAGSSRRRGAICLIEAEAARLTAHHDGPVIAAGSTGSMPATAKFLHAVAKPAARRGGAAGARYRSRRGGVASDRRRQGRAGRIHRRRPHPTIRNSRCMRCSTRFGIKRGDVEILGDARAARARGAGLRGDAAVERDRAMARAAGTAGDRGEDCARHDKSRRDRGAQSGDGGACDRGRDARGAASRTNRRRW